MAVISNCNIDIFIFHHRFCIMSPKFMKFERSPKFCRKVSKIMKVKAQSYVIEQNWMKLLFSII